MLLPREFVTIGGLVSVLIGALAMLAFPRQMAHWGANNWWARLFTPRRVASQHRETPLVIVRAIGAAGLLIALITIVAVATSS